MILIASGQAILRKRWAETLKESSPVAEVAERAALERKMARLRPPVLLLDLALPGLDSLNGVSSVQRFCPVTRIILLTPAPDDEEAISALKLGVRGYWGSDLDDLSLAKAVEVVRNGEIWIGRKLIPKLLSELQWLTERQEEISRVRMSLDLGSLSAREQEVARLIGDGLCNKEIASHLDITERTVKAHLTKIFRKLKISDRLHLAVMVADYHRTAASPSAPEVLNKQMKVAKQKGENRPG